MIDQPKPHTGDSCGTCRFAQHGPNHKQGDHIACRRMPPTLMYAATQGQLVANGPTRLSWNTAAGFPLVAEQSWCGEFRPLDHSAILKQ